MNKEKTAEAKAQPSCQGTSLFRPSLISDPTVHVVFTPSLLQIYLGMFVVLQLNFHATGHEPQSCARYSRQFRLWKARPHHHPDIKRHVLRPIIPGYQNPREALYKHSGIYLPAVHAKASPWMCTKVLHEFRSHGQCTYGGCHQPCPVHRLFVAQKANGFNLAIQSDQLIQSWSCVNITRHKQYCTLPSDVPPPLPQ